LTTASDGTINSAFPYESGKQLYVYYESSNDKQWFPSIVPEMNPEDARASTYNVVKLQSFAVGTYSTDALKYANGTSIADAGEANKTIDGSTPKFTYSLANTGNDNTGMIGSYDPSYKMRFDPVLYMTLSGTGYESVLVYGTFDADFTLGTTHYLAKTLDPYALTKHKEGWEYKSHGTQDIGFWMDISGLESGDSVTLQIYVYGYSDPTWCMNHGGDYGYKKVELAEHTITIVP